MVDASVLTKLEQTREEFVRKFAYELLDGIVESFDWRRDRSQSLPLLGLFGKLLPPNRVQVTGHYESYYRGREAVWQRIKDFLFHEHLEGEPMYQVIHDYWKANANNEKGFYWLAVLSFLTQEKMVMSNSLIFYDIPSYWPYEFEILSCAEQGLLRKKTTIRYRLTALHPFLVDLINEMKKLHDILPEFNVEVEQTLWEGHPELDTYIKETYRLRSESAFAPSIPPKPLYSERVVEFDGSKAKVMSGWPPNRQFRANRPGPHIYGEGQNFFMFFDWVAYTREVIFIKITKWTKD